MQHLCYSCPEFKKYDSFISLDLQEIQRSAERCDRPPVKDKETDLKEAERWPDIHNLQMLAVWPEPTNSFEFA